MDKMMAVLYKSILPLFFLFFFPLEGKNFIGKIEKTDDIIVLTIPKAGHHLIGKALELMTGKDWFYLRSFYDKYQLDVFAGEEEFSLQRLEKAMDWASKGNKLVRGHTNYVPIISTYTEKHPHWKRILMARDLRDVLVSLTFYHEKELDKELGSNSSFKKRMIYEMTTQYESNYNRPIMRALKAFEWIQQDPELFICRFEDLVGPKGGGDLDKQKEALFSLSSHIGMKLSTKRLKYVLDNLFGGTKTFRSGQIGSWKEYFDEELKEIFKQSQLGQLLIDLGYENDHNW